MVHRSLFALVCGNGTRPGLRTLGLSEVGETFFGKAPNFGKLDLSVAVDGAFQRPLRAKSGRPSR